jgi:hypothetical protein
VIGIAFQVAKKAAGGAQICTEHGIVVAGGSKNAAYYVPSDRLNVLASGVVLCNKLESIQTAVRQGTFVEEEFPR